MGIDIDPEPLAWGAKHNIQPLGARASLVRLLQQDARDPCRGPFDVSVALNFSYFVFETREELRRYFAGVRRSMAPDGIFVLDAYGGSGAWRCLSERRRVGDFTYVWEQAPHVRAVDFLTLFASGVVFGVSLMGLIQVWKAGSSTPG